MYTNLVRPLTFLSPPTHNQFVFRCEMRLKTDVNRNWRLCAVNWNADCRS